MIPLENKDRMLFEELPLTQSKNDSTIGFSSSKLLQITLFQWFICTQIQEINAQVTL